LFDSLSGAEQQATMKEVQPYAGPTMISAMQAAVVLNQATTVPLPTDDQETHAYPDDNDPQDLHNFTSRARLRQETFNRRLRCFEVLPHTFTNVCVGRTSSLHYYYLAFVVLTHY
jgi:hypothetical protein